MEKTRNDVALQMLRKLYGYDLAVVKQSGTLLSKQDELESLAIHHLDKQVAAAVEEFIESVGDDQQMESGAVAVLMGFCGVMMAEIQKKRGKQAANSAIRFGKKYLEKRYTDVLGEKNNDND